MKKIAAIGMILLCCGFARPGLADDGEFLRKTNLVAIQNMLTQRLAKAACFIGTFTETDQYRDILIQSREMFDANLMILKEGHVAYGIDPANDVVVLDQLKRLEPVWRRLKFASDLLAESPQYPGLDVNMIEEFNISTLKLTEELGDYYRSRIADEPDAVEMVRLTGALATLSQRAAKEFCMTSYGLSANINRNALARSIQEFDQILEDLMVGNEAFNIIAPPEVELAQALNELKREWNAPKRVMMAIANSMHAKTSDFSVISRTSEVIMKQSRKIADLYLNHYKKVMAEKAIERQFSQGS
ncbi:MAG: type IV pili methyl-accepting chemotaxis transducer N-terminal domain-containing protein [Terasakiella sp.]|uniref:type IV pili methyl-accepting chemotaxis transducer N-terminal domain-containing protein n=1 Tax=unclassified Terasakiella TaxID=2614952 RepID=UPI003B009104